MNRAVIEIDLSVTDFRSLAENLPTLCWMANADGWITWYNRRWYAFTGTTPAEMEGWGWQKVHHPDRLPDVLAAWKSSVATGRAFEMTFPLKAADGTFRPFLTRIEPVRDGVGQVAGWYGVNTDILEQVAAEEALRIERDQGRAMLRSLDESETRHRFILSLADRMGRSSEPREIIAAAVEVLGRHLGVNRVGYGEICADDQTVIYETDYADGVAHLVGRFPLDMFGTENVADLRRGITTAYADVTSDPRTADAGFDAIETRSAMAVPLIREGRLSAALYLNHRDIREWRADEVTLVQDVAARTWDTLERARAEALLRDLNETLEQRVEERTRERDRAWRLSRDLLLVIEIDGTVKSVNAAWTDILGWEEGELLGTSLPLLVHPEDLPTSLAVLGGIVKEPLTEPYESRLRHRDGSYRWFAWTAAFEDGQVYASGRHTTAEHDKSAALHAAEEALRQAQKMEAVGQLTGGVAHDFNNLLTVIRSSIDLLRRPDLAVDRRRRYMDAISDTVTRAAKLTGQLLAFARRQTLQPEVFDAGKGVSAIGDMLGTLTGSRIVIDLTVPDTPCVIDADPSQFDTAIVNMAVNARDAMNGEGRLTIAVGCSVGIPASGAQPASTGEFVSVSISDTGTGIAEADLTRIFEPFFTTKGVGEGTGLGLSQVFGFAKQSGGEVRVESELGRGSTFTLYLPHVSAAVLASAKPEAETERVVDGHGTCVLVVEDNEDVGNFAMQALEELGYRTVWATNAKEALAELGRDADRFDVVFSDVVMPGMSGIDLAHEIRRLYHDLPVILTSGYSHVLARNGTYGFELLHKPYSVEQLSRILRKAASWQRRKQILDT